MYVRLNTFSPLYHLSQQAKYGCRAIASCVLAQLLLQLMITWVWTLSYCGTINHHHAESWDTNITSLRRFITMLHLRGHSKLSISHRLLLVPRYLGKFTVIFTSCRHFVTGRASCKSEQDEKQRELNKTGILEPSIPK